MLKFRSMVVDAVARLVELVAASEAAGPPLKMKWDPVLGGTMSLVGPRQPLPRYVENWNLTLDALSSGRPSGPTGRITDIATPLEQPVCTR